MSETENQKDIVDQVDETPTVNEDMSAILSEGGIEFDPMAYYQQIIDTHTPEKEQEILAGLNPLIDYIKSKKESLLETFNESTEINRDNFKSFFPFDQEDETVVGYIQKLQEAESVALITKQAGKASEDFLNALEEVTKSMYEVNQLFHGLYLPSEEELVEVKQHVDFELVRCLAMKADNSFTTILRNLVKAKREGTLTVEDYQAAVGLANGTYDKICEFSAFTEVPTGNIDKAYQNLLGIIDYICKDVKGE